MSSCSLHHILQSRDSLEDDRYREMFLKALREGTYGSQYYGAHSIIFTTEVMGIDSAVLIGQE